MRLQTRSGSAAVCYWALLCGSALGQTPSQWPCMDEVGGHAIRTSAGVSGRMAQKKVVPDISDIKDTKLDSIVVVMVIVDAEGNVRCGRAEKGDSELFPRSVEAAEKWQFKPYLRNGQGRAVQTEIQFRYKKHKVEAMVPDR